MSIALYVHIPFCETKCPYCDFNTYARIETLIPGYVDALNTEMEVWGELLDRPEVATVFFGGGTPSYLDSEQIRSLLETIRHAFDTTDVAEITLEANPGDFSPEKLADYLNAGVDRLSIGVQSLDDRLLEMLGRRHSADDAVSAFRMAGEAGFENVSIDLMYGLPHQSLADWEATLSGAGELMPQHVSMYCLTLEGGTSMERWVESGRLPEPDPDLAADMYLAAEAAMSNAGYHHYEISNWARTGHESLHNLVYWKNRPYLGVGPGAHSYLDGHRFRNLRSPKEYIRRLAEAPSLTLHRNGGEDILTPPENVTNGVGDFQRVPVVEDVEPIARPMEMAETMMMGLRLRDGIDDGEFGRRFGVAPSDVYGEILDDLRSTGLLETPDGVVRLTDRGRLLGNEVFRRFFEDGPSGA